MQTELENRVHIDSTVSPIDNIGTVALRSMTTLS